MEKRFIKYIEEIFAQEEIELKRIKENDNIIIEKAVT